jgi:hypothetical protein
MSSPSAEQTIWTHDHPVCSLCNDLIHYRNETVLHNNTMTHILCVYPELTCMTCKRAPTKHEVAITSAQQYVHTTCQDALTTT